MLNCRISPFGPLIRSFSATRHNLRYLSRKPPHGPLSPWPLDTLFITVDRFTLCSILPPLRDTYEPPARFNWRNNAVRSILFPLSFSLLPCLSLTFTFLYYLLAKHNARPLDSSSTSARTGYAPSTMLCFYGVYLLSALIYRILGIFSIIRMHIVEVSDSSSERKRTKERKRWNFTISLREDEESDEPMVCIPVWYAIQIWMVCTSIWKMFLHIICRKINQLCNRQKFIIRISTI